MSGGSYGYAYQRVEDVAFEIEKRHMNSPLFRAFAKRLREASVVMREIEWADSCDTSQEDAAKAIRAFFEGEAIELHQSFLMAQEAADRLSKSIAEANPKSLRFEEVRVLIKAGIIPECESSGLYSDGWNKALYALECALDEAETAQKKCAEAKK